MQEIKLKIGGTLLVEDWEYNNAFRVRNQNKDI